MLLGNLPYGHTIDKISVPDRLRLKFPFHSPTSDRLRFVTNLYGGQGITPSTLTLLTGTPSAGKSTLLLQMAHALHSNPDCFVLFSGGEESLYQTKMVCERLFHKREPNFYVGEERLLDSQAKDLHPKYVQLAARGQQRSVLGHMRTLMRKHPNKQPILLMDALQSFDDGKYADGYTNSQTPFRVLKAVNDFCKSTFASAIVVGQVTKSGDPLGANKIIHEIDTLLHLFFDVREKSVTHGMRIIQTRKNRYGCAQQAHVVIMESDGLREDGAIYED